MTMRKGHDPLSVKVLVVGPRGGEQSIIGAAVVEFLRDLGLHVRHLDAELHGLGEVPVARAEDAAERAKKSRGHVLVEVIPNGPKDAR